MKWRGPVALVALLAIGAGGGYAASAQSRDGSIGSGVPAPVPAQAPEMPVEAPQPPVPDPTDPPLEPDIAMAPQKVGTGKFEITFPAPVGWSTNANASNEWKWKKPGTSNNTYVMRIEQINSQDITIEDAINIRIERLRAEQDDVVIVDRGRGDARVHLPQQRGQRAAQLHALARPRRQRPGRRGDRRARPERLTSPARVTSSAGWPRACEGAGGGPVG